MKVSFHQEHFVLQLVESFQDQLAAFGMVKADGSIIGKDTPAIPGQVLSKSMLPQDAAEEAQVAGLPYAKLVGSLLYVANASRHDLLVAVANMAKFMSRFGLQHWLAALRCLQFLSRYTSTQNCQ